MMKSILLLHLEARLPNNIGAEEANKPSRKIVVIEDFSSSFASAVTCGNLAYFLSNSCIFIRNCVQNY